VVAGDVEGREAGVRQIPDAAVRVGSVHLGLYPIVTLEKQLLNMTGNLV
jgi:hypothetical protein